MRPLYLRTIHVMQSISKLFYNCLWGPTSYCSPSFFQLNCLLFFLVFALLQTYGSPYCSLNYPLSKHALPHGSSNTLATWCEEQTLRKRPNAGKDWQQEEKGTMAGISFQTRLRGKPGPPLRRRPTSCACAARPWASRRPRSPPAWWVVIGLCLWSVSFAPCHHQRRDV